MPDLPLVRRAADLLLTYDFTPWFYGDSVGMEGLLCAGDLLHDPFYEGFVEGLARGALARDAAYRPMDNTIPGRALTEVAVRRSDDRLMRRLGEAAAVLRDRPRINGVPVSLDRALIIEPYGGSALPDDERLLLADPGPGIYVDCLHFEPPFLVSYGHATGDSQMVEDGIAMTEAFISMLQSAGGLFDHFYLGSTDRTYIPGWTRGQGWAALGLLDVLETVGPTQSRVARVREALKRLAHAMLQTQRADGHWGSLAEPGTVAETSAAAFFAAIFLRMERLGLGTAEMSMAGQNALRATLASVDDTGWLRGVSATVWSSTQLDHYRHVPLDFMVPWSQGPLLMALWEAERLNVTGQES